MKQIQRKQISVTYVDPLKRGQLIKTKLCEVTFDTSFFFFFFKGLFGQNRIKVSLCPHGQHLVNCIEEFSGKRQLI